MAKQWYIIHTYSGFEKKVKESLESRVAAFGLQEKIGRMMIPTEDVVEVRGGKKLISSRMLYPGYVLVEMDMDDYTWHVVRNTPRVTGFVGSGETPTPLSDVEVENILHRVTTSADRPKPKLVFERNEQVRITEGPFANFTGVVEDVNADRSTLLKSKRSPSFAASRDRLHAGESGELGWRKKYKQPSSCNCPLGKPLRRRRSAPRSVRRA